MTFTEMSRLNGCGGGLWLVKGLGRQVSHNCIEMTTSSCTSSWHVRHPRNICYTRKLLPWNSGSTALAAGDSEREACEQCPDDVTYDPRDWDVKPSMHCTNIYTVNNTRISTDIGWRVFHILTEPVPYILQCGPELQYSVDLRIQTYTEPVPLK